MHVLPIINQKGGSCKTATTVNLAAALAELGERVLVIDLDPQAHASIHLGVIEGGRGLADLLTEQSGSLRDLVRPSSAPGVDLVPSSETLWGVERYHAVSGTVAAEQVLKHAIQGLGPQAYDWVLIDCPPSLGQLVVMALVAATGVLVPVEASVAGYAGVGPLMRRVEQVRQALNPGLEIVGVLLCRVEHTLHAEDVGELLSKHFGDRVLPVKIRKNVRAQEAFGCRVPVTVYATKSPAAEDYRAAASYLSRHLAAVPS